MAKNNPNNKKKSDSKKSQDIKSSRGRPSKTESAVLKTKQTVKTNIKEEVNVGNVINEKKQTETTKQKLSGNDLLVYEIYGDEPAKEYVPFPSSEQRTQTTGLIKEYGINIERLPKDILDLVNDFTTIFTTIHQNAMMAGHYINEFLEKDTKSFNALKEWIEPKKEKLISLKVKTQGGVSVVSESSKVVIDSSNVNNLPPTMNTTPNSQINHGSNPIAPRKAEGSYQHNIHSNPIIPKTSQNLGLNPNENKDIHYEMLNKHSHFKDVHIQQNLQYKPEDVVPVSPEKYIQDYADSIMKTINSTFQIIHWGFIPLNVLQDILNNADKSFGYEVIQGGSGSYINITKGEHKVTTPKFAIK